MANVKSEVTHRRSAKGHFRGGLPYARLGRGPRPLIAILGLMLENAPPPSMALRMYRFGSRDFTVVAVTPAGSAAWQNHG